MSKTTKLEPETARGETFLRFVEVIAKLRDPNGGCPWDLEQTHRSIRQYLVEETYEVIDAIDAGDDRSLREELGDLLLQVVLHSQIAADRGAFHVDDVTSYVTEKMIRRHPHVFGTTQVEGTSEVLKNWEAIKAEERRASGAPDAPPPSLLDGIPRELPALLRAQRVGEKVTKVHFDWERLDDVRAKITEELAEVDAEVAAMAHLPAKPLTTTPKQRSAEEQARLEDEIGDVLFSVCQYARWLGVSAEDSLRRTIDKFTARFRHMEGSAERPLADLSPGALDKLWNQAKTAVKEGKR